MFCNLVENGGIGDADALIFVLEDCMRRRDRSQNAGLTADLQPFSNLKDFSHVKTGKNVPGNGSRAQAKGDAECQSAGCENQAGHDAQHFGVELELRNRHDADDERATQRGGEVDAGVLARFFDRISD